MARTRSSAPALACLLRFIQHGTPLGVTLGAAKLWYDKPYKRFYLLVSPEIEGAAPTPEAHQRIVGVDVGQRYLAVATDTQNTTTFYPAKRYAPKRITLPDCGSACNRKAPDRQHDGSS